MAEFKDTTFILDHKFDPVRNRHYLNGMVSVLHCHHYSTLYTQLALDAKETALLADVSEETFCRVLKKYYEDYQVTELEQKIDLACQYYAAVGLGKMEMEFAGDFSGEVRLAESHLDQGWIKKWGVFDRPVNYITAGFIAGMFAACFDKDVGTYTATERESIAMGAEKSVFSVERK
jgi:hypothetical protein